MKIKKLYQELVEYLEANLDKKVKSVMPFVYELAEAKRVVSSGPTYLRNTAKEVVAIRCWYYKQWFPVFGENAVEFGGKKDSATGYTNVSKLGQSNFHRQKREYEAANEVVFKRILAEDLDVIGAKKELEQLEAQKTTPIPHKFPVAFDELDDMKEWLTKEGITLEDN